MIDKAFEGQTIVVTGAARGLGLGMARRFGRAGAHVVIADIDRESGLAAASSLTREGLSAGYVALDVRDPRSCQAVADAIVEARQGIHVWVNNAGVTHTSPAESLSADAWEESLAVLLSGAFYCCQAVGRHMLRRRRGVIINIASVHGFRAAEERVAYCTAKAGLIMLTQALGVEWAGRGVRVVGVAPGVVSHGHLLQNPADDPDLVTVYKRRTPLHRLGRVEEVAEAVAYLASDEASYVVAETLRVDGGWVSYQLF